MEFRTVAALAGAALLAGCGGGGVEAPAQVQGSWGADCASPFVGFKDGQVTVFPDKATYTLKSANLAATSSPSPTTAARARFRRFT